MKSISYLLLVGLLSFAFSGQGVRAGGCDKIQQLPGREDATLNSYLDTFIVAQTVLLETFDNSRSYRISLGIAEASAQDYEIILPSLESVQELEHIFIGNYKKNSSHTYQIRVEDNTLLRLANTDRFAENYTIDPGEQVRISKKDGAYRIEVSSEAVEKFFAQEVIASRGFEKSKANKGAGSYSLARSIPVGLTEDNLLVTPVRDKAPLGENLLFKSNQFNHGSFATHWSVSADAVRRGIETNVAEAPDGTLTADLFKLSGATSFTLQQLIRDVELTSGTELTFSLYARYVGSDEATIQNVRISDRSGFIASSTIAPPVRIATEDRGDFLQYTFRLKMTRTPTTPSLAVDFANFSGTDSLYLAFAQLERVPGGVASVYKETGLTPHHKILRSDTLYSLVNVNNGFVELDAIYDPSYSSDELLRSAIAYCEVTAGCVGVELADGMTFEEGAILIPENFTLKGKGSRKTKVFASLSDPGKSLFISRDDGNKSYVVGQRYQGFGVEVLDSLNIVIEARFAYDQRFTDLAIDGNYKAQTLIKIGEKDHSGAIATQLNKCQLQQAGRENILYERCGNNHRIEGGNSGRSRAGIACYTDIGSLYVAGSWDAEDNVHAVDFGEAGGGSLSFSDCYFEQKSNTGLADFRFGSFESLVFRQGFMTMSTWEFGDRMGNIKFSSVGFNVAPVFRSIGNHQGPYKDSFSPKKHPNRLSVTDCSFVRSAGYEGLDAAYGHLPWFTMSGSVTTADGGDAGLVAPNINVLRSVQGKLVDGTLDGGTLGGEVATAGLNFVGGEQNLTSWSDSLNAVKSPLITISSNVADGPYGKPAVADELVSNSNSNANIPIRVLQLSETIAEGSAYTISFWAKVLSAEANVGFRISTPGGDKTGILSREWKRYEINVAAAAEAYEKLKVECRGRKEGDRILFAGWQVNHGLQATPYVATSTTGIHQDSIANFGGTIHFTGDLRRSDRAEGSVFTTTNANGDVIVKHDLGFTPTNITITPRGAGDAPLLYQVLTASIDASTFTVRVFADFSSAAKGEEVSFYWSVE